jgi:hypothetical protein
VTFSLQLEKKKFSSKIQKLPFFDTLIFFLISLAILEDLALCSLLFQEFLFCLLKMTDFLVQKLVKVRKKKKKAIKAIHQKKSTNQFQLYN